MHYLSKQELITDTDKHPGLVLLNIFASYDFYRHHIAKFGSLQNMNLLTVKGKLNCC